jgi:hypothetical protein
MPLKRPKSQMASFARAGSGPPGYAMNAAWMPGPRYSDAFQRQRSPNPIQLVEAWKSLIFACSDLAATSTIRVPLRLYSASGGGRQKARSYCGPRPISRRMYRRFQELPWVARSMGVSTLEDVEEITSHPVLEALDNPTGTDDDDQDYFDRETFLGTIVRYVDIVGVAYVKPEGPRGLPPELLWPLQSQYVWPQRLDCSARIKEYKYFLETYAKADLIRFRLRNSLVDPYGGGYAAAQAAWQYARLEDSFTSIQEQVLSIGARPSLLISPKDPSMPIGPDEQKKLAADLNSTKSGPNAGRHIVTDGSIDVTPISYPPADVGQTEISRYDFERVCNCWGIPPTIFTTESNLANQQASDRALAKNCSEPRCKMIASVLTRLVRRSDDRLFFAFDPAVAEDLMQEATIFDMGLKTGRFTINETLKETEYDDKPYGDEAWLPGTLKQPGMLIEAHQAGLDAQKQQVDSATTADALAEDGQAHTQEMDKKRLEFDKKTASAKASSEKRSLAAIDDVIESIQVELGITRKAGNPNHVPSGEHGGEFTSGSGGGAAGNHGHAPGKHHAKNQRKKAKKHLTSGKPGGGGGKGATSGHKMTAKEKADRIKKGKPLTGLSVKAARAQKNAVKTDKTVQDYTKANEHVFAKRMGGESFPDTEPADVHLQIGGKTHGLELKTLTHGKNDKITMSKSAIARKVAWEKVEGTMMNTVALDHRDVFAGGKNAALHSGHEIYYMRGVGSPRIKNMYKVKDEAELHKLLRTPYDKLPPAAQGPIRGTKT